MEEFNSRVYINYNVQMTEALTISRLALNIFLKKYLKKSRLPSIINSNTFNFIKFGYYGGMTEVYIPYGEDLKYVDVNSLYPHAALNPMPGIICEYLESFEEKGLNLDDKLFGFFYAEVNTINTNNYLGLLPFETKNGLIFPNGRFSGV